MNKLTDEHIDKVIEVLRFGICPAPVNMIAALKELKRLRIGDNKIVLNNFTKKDLKEGMIVEFECGEKAIVSTKKFNSPRYGDQNILFTSDKINICGSCYKDDLTTNGEISFIFNIKKIYYPELIWERKSVIKILEDEDNVK